MYVNPKKLIKIRHIPVVLKHAVYLRFNNFINLFKYMNFQKFSDFKPVILGRK